MKKLSLVGALLLPALAFAQQYSIDSYRIAGGGGTSSGGVYSVTGIIGQPDASGWTGGGAALATGGFWVVQAIGAPTLTVAAASAGQVTISWEPKLPGWILQESPTLTSPSWTNSATGEANPVIIPATGTKFFRLHKLYLP